MHEDTAKASDGESQHSGDGDRRIRNSRSSLTTANLGYVRSCFKQNKTHTQHCPFVGLSGSCHDESSVWAGLCSVSN